MDLSAPKQNLSTPLKSKSVNSTFSFKNIDEISFWRVVILVSVAVFISALLYFFLWIGQENEIRNYKKSNKIGVQVQNQNSKKPTADLDQERKDDTLTINSILKTYFLKNKKSPETLKELVPDYIKNLPTDPKTKDSYNYKLSTDKKSWEVSAVLSNGSSFTAQGP